MHLGIGDARRHVYVRDGGRLAVQWRSQVLPESSTNETNDDRANAKTFLSFCVLSQSLYIPPKFVVKCRAPVRRPVKFAQVGVSIYNRSSLTPA